jgi:hypothetical protein
VAPRKTPRKPALTAAGRTSRVRSPLPSTLSQSPTPRSLSGSLPLNFRTSAGGSELVPATVFAPPHLRAVTPLVAPSPPAQITVVARGTASARSSAIAATTTTTTTPPAIDGPLPSADHEFIQHTELLLTDGCADGIQSRFTASATDATYDFNEYKFLRNTDDPFSPGLTVGPGSTQLIPSDPRFKRFVREGENGVASFLEYVSLSVQGSIPAYLLTERINSMRSVLPSWWFDVCAIRAFNQLGRYSRSDINRFFGYGFTPEQYYGYSLSNWLGSTAYAEVQEYLATGNGTPSGSLKKLLTVAYWEDVLTSVFTQYFDGNGIHIVDPSASRGEYPFDPFPANEVLFGLRVIHRQTWHLLDYARGELVRSIPLGPKESQKISLRTLRRAKVARTTEEGSSFETSADSSTGSKDTSEVIDEASLKLNVHAEAEVGVDIFTLVKANVSAGASADSAVSSKQTKSRLNELMQKTASRMKRDTKVTVSTEQENTFEETRSSELSNPNDEIAVTYLYHRLQQRYWVSTEIAEVHSVVFVPEPLPAWEDVDEAWVRDHADVIAGVLLDPGSASVLAAIRREPANLAYTPTPMFAAAGNAGIAAAGAYRDFKGGAMPDLLASGQESFERDYERRNTLAMDQARRQHQSLALLTHIRRNILHYMRAIWASEDYDQRMQRLSRIRVPVSWNFVPRAPVPPGAGPDLPLQVEGVFMPDSGSARPLTDIIDPIGPIGFLFNSAIYRLRDDPKLVNLHQALAYLRAAYVRFAVTVTIGPGAGVTFRQAVAASPRSFSADYTFTYRTNRGKWLIPVPGRTEGDWIEVKALPDGSLDALGLRIWLDGTPANGAIVTIRVRATADLEDPHLRLVALLHPLPTPADEPVVFTDDLLAEMVAVLGALVPPGLPALTWATLSEAQKAKFRDHYHLFLMLRESGRLVTLDTANLVLDLEISTTPALEPFKRLHRYLDVRKAYEELRRGALDNARRQALQDKGSLGDPDIERVTLVGARSDLKDVIAVADGPED